MNGFCLIIFIHFSRNEGYFENARLTASKVNTTITKTIRWMISPFRNSVKNKNYKAIKARCLQFSLFFPYF